MVVGNLRAVNNTKVVDNRVVGVAIMVDNTDVVQRKRRGGSQHQGDGHHQRGTAHDGVL